MIQSCVKGDRIQWRNTFYVIQYVEIQLFNLRIKADGISNRLKFGKKSSSSGCVNEVTEPRKEEWSC